MIIKIDFIKLIIKIKPSLQVATLAQLGERQTEDLKALCSIHRSRTFFLNLFVIFNYQNVL